MASNVRQPFLRIAVGTNGTGKSSLLKQYLELSPRNLIVPANRNDAGVTWPGIEELAVKAIYEPDALDPKGKEVLVIHAPEMHKFHGNRLLHIDSDTRRVSALTHPKLGFQTGTLFLDDFRKYVPHKGDLPPHLANMFGDRRHINLDIWVAVHSFNDINIQLLGWDCELYIFRTTLPPSDAVRGKVRNWDQLLETIDRVNRKAIHDPHYVERFVPSKYE